MQTTAAVATSSVTNGPETTTDNSLPIDVLLAPSDTFARRHIGPSDSDIESMLKVIGLDSLETLIDQTVPKAIRLKKPLRTGEPRTEHQTLIDLKAMASKNKVFRSLIGQGYHDTITPPVILRNIMENPGWYTQYTPYQAEISQGRLEALLNYQTMICDLTGLEVSNASLLDEGTAAAEAMTICRSQVANADLDTFVIDDLVHPQTIAVVKTRADSMGIKVVVACTQTSDLSKAFGALVQYPTTDGSIEDYSKVAEKLHAQGALLVAAADLLSLTILKPPGEWGADIAVGSSQRFGVPLGFGGPHAGYMAVRNAFVRRMPGRLVGVSKDAHGNKAYRLTLQTREQHIRRERATSNICTAQVLLAVMAGMYAVYHGPQGLKRIAKRVRLMTTLLARSLDKIGHEVVHTSFFDTLRVKPVGITASEVKTRALKAQINLRYFDDGSVGVTLDELTTRDEVLTLIGVFLADEAPSQSIPPMEGRAKTEVAKSIFDLSLNSFAIFDGDQLINAPKFGAPLVSRTSPILTHPIFNTHHSESEMLRYMWHLQGKDISLVHSMIPLGSCTMKLNATTEMIPVTWPEFGKLHPFAPSDQWKGYAVLFKQLEKWLNEITGFDATWLQPNAGSQGEYAGLLMIREYHLARGQTQRTVCLIPESAHGTNPASAVIAGMSVVGVACKENGDIDLDDLLAKAEAHKDTLSCMMITYPSTHGVFEEGVKQACKIIHDRGGQVYMDGANMNAQVGLCRPGDIGADVCHLNLHKTFCIPHGGGGPGMGPICMKKHLAAFVPSSDEVTKRRSDEESASPSSLCHSVTPSLAVSAAPYGSPSILTISWAYIAMMGGVGLKRATQVAILNANYMAGRLKDHYPILFTGANGRCAHEFILDCRDLDRSAGIKVEDIAKRLMDYGFHAPTMSWPVGGTLMIEPTESEPRPELDRLCDALIAIRAEIREIEEGKLDRADNMLKHAPHTAQQVLSDSWSHKYPRERAAYPLPWVREKKFWPSVGRIDNAFGDRNLVCACPPMSDYQ
jgi:glycine dehydrogenase